MAGHRKRRNNGNIDGSGSSKYKRYDDFEEKDLISSQARNRELPDLRYSLTSALQLEPHQYRHQEPDRFERQKRKCSKYEECSQSKRPCTRSYDDSPPQHTGSADCETMMNYSYNDPPSAIINIPYIVCEVEKIANQSPFKTVQSVNENIQLFCQFIHHCSLQDYDHISLVVKILANICTIVGNDYSNSAAIELKNKSEKILTTNIRLFDNICHTFWGKLASCIRTTPYSDNNQLQPLSVSTYNFMSDVQTILRIFLYQGREIFPDIRKVIPVLPVDDFQGALRQLCNNDSVYRSLYEQSQQLIHKRDKLRESCCVSNDIRKFFVLPDRRDLLCKSLPYNLKKNKNTYSSKKEYLEIHLNLLRQDFIHPLRCVIHDLRDQISEEYEEDSTDIYVVVYENVKFFRKDVCGGELVYKVKFSLPKNRKINWDHSRRFTYGSIVCLSNDNFDTFLYATVASRDVQELKRNIVTLKLLEISEQLLSEESSINSRIKYKMIESPAYFEAYSSVVDQLNVMKENCDNLPALVERYMLTKKDVKDDKRLPDYLDLQASEGCSMNLSGVLCSCKGECIHGNESIDVTKKFNNANATLDSSQVDALFLAISAELSLIQGPPGTGKTFVGVQFVKALLRNREVWSVNNEAPILVMCQTNHALDQFLEEILEMKATEKIVRIGGRSKSEKMMSMNLKNMKRQIREERKELKRYAGKEARKSLPSFTSFCREDLIVAETKYEALEELICPGLSYNELNERLYCSFLSPGELEHPDYWPIKDRIAFSREDNIEVAIQKILKWFNFKTIEKQCKPHEDDVYYDAKALEDERKIDKDPKTVFEGTKIYAIAEDKGKFREFFKKLRRAEPKKYKYHELRIDEKCELLKYCMRNHLKRLKKIIESQKKKKDSFEEEDEYITLSALRHADIVGVTTTGASIKTKILQKLGCKIIIVEEAAEVMEAHILAALSKHTQQLVLIGDHKQLRPKANNFIIGRKYGLETSIFERLIRNGLPSVQLKYQHRMRPEIAELVRPHIYKELFDHEKVKSYEPILGMKKSLFFIDHKFQEKNFEGLISPANNHEASFIIHLADYLLHQRYHPDQLTVLTPYSGQVASLKQEMNALKVRPIHIVPVDNFQGEENDIILLSLVRSKKSGFVKEENRICVALSRARKGLYVIGNFSNLFTQESKTWLNIIENLKKTGHFGTSLPLQCSLHDHVTEITEIGDFKQVKDGGCSEKCGKRLQCGHICPRNCHPDDVNHENYKCQKPCIRKCSNDHTCPEKCYETCPPCNEPVLKKIPMCQHEQLVPCNIEPVDFVCQEDCQKELSCGHKCQKKCGEMCTVECGVLVMKSLPCGHDAQTECYRKPSDQMNMCKIPCNTELMCGHLCKGTCGRCHQGRLHTTCQEKCDRILMCGHRCKSNTCAHDCPPCQGECPAYCSHGPCGHKCESFCIECAEPCQWKCPHYQCNKTCGEFCDRPRCNECCELQLKCGHHCLGLCGEPCPPLCRECDPNNEAFTILFGEEDEPDSCFILLECKHCIEVTGLDCFMDENNDENHEVQWKGCPHCKTPIMCLRYGNIIKQIKKDMTAVKRKESQKLNETDRHRMESETREWNEILQHLCYSKSSDIKKLSDIRLQGLHTRLYAAIECDKLLTFFSNSKLYRRLHNQTKKLKEYVLSNHHIAKLLSLPQQVSNDIHCERRRLCLLMKVYELKNAAKAHNQTFNQRDQHHLQNIIDNLNPSNYKPNFAQIITEELFLEECGNITEISQKYHLGRLTEKERAIIVAAIGGKRGSWYKCPKGHFYYIGECGGAMQIGKCNECGAQIGGTNHRLLDSNAHAGEMDQSRHAAWSEQANMENYELHID